MKFSMYIAALHAALLCLVLAVSPAGSGSMTLLGVGKTAAAGGGCSQATTFLARTSGLNGTETTAYTTMICGLVTDGIITGTMNGANSGAGACGSILDGLWIAATNTTATSLLNLCGTSYTLTANGSCTFTADVGYACDGSTGFFDTNFQPGTATTPNIGTNTASVGVAVQTARTTVHSWDIMGLQDNVGSSKALLFEFFNGASGAYVYDLGDNSFSGTTGLASTKGIFVGSRQSPSTVNLYLNGNTTPINTNASATFTGYAACNLYISARCLLVPAVTANNFNTDQWSAAWVGAGMTSAQVAAISNRVNTFLLATGNNIY